MQNRSVPSVLKIWIDQFSGAGPTVLDGQHDYNYIVALIVLREFEHLILSTANLGNGAYGAATRQAIETTTGRACSLGTLPLPSCLVIHFGVFLAVVTPRTKTLRP